MTSLRVAAEERRNAHRHDIRYDAEWCLYCDEPGPCADRTFAELVITTLNEAETWYRDQHHYEHGGWGQVRLHTNDEAVRLVPDPLGEHAN